MAILPPVFRQRYFTASGEPLAGGKLYTYIAGTTTPQATYTDATETTANANPIILDANGECSLWLGSSSYKILLTDSADVSQWTQDYVNQSSIQSLASADYLENLGITCSTNSNALTVNVKTASGDVPGVGSPVRAGFRSSSLASGLVSLVEIISPLSMTVSAGSTLGHTSGVDLYIYVYLINYNGVAELAVSGTFYPESSLVTTVAEGGAGGADTLATIYSITARTNVPIRLIGRLTSNQVTAGQWATMPSEIQTGESARNSSVGTSQIANLAVTTAKLADGAVTNAKKGAPNFSDAAFTGTLFNTTSYVTISTISSFAVAGRLCQFGVYPAAEDAYIEISSGGAASDVFSMWRIWDATNSVAIAYFGLPGISLTSGTSNKIILTHFATHATMSAGTRNLELQGKLQSAGGRQVAYSTTMKFFAREL